MKPTEEEKKTQVCRRRVGNTEGDTICPDQKNHGSQFRKKGTHQIHREQKSSGHQYYRPRLGAIHRAHLRIRHRKAPERDT